MLGLNISILGLYLDQGVATSSGMTIKTQVCRNAAQYFAVHFVARDQGHIALFCLLVFTLKHCQIRAVRDNKFQATKEPLVLCLV